ncbi:MAG: hypothetical protein HY556_00180 [Euryarchaeota archaeon]|nr:hypothetical protein [Euryarchaeota archaeon]
MSPFLALGLWLLLSGTASAGHLAPPEAVSLEPGSVHTFTAPETSYSAFVDVVGSANSSLLLSSYVASGDHILAPLCHAVRRGVEVEMLLDGSPVGGIADEERVFIETALASGVRVTLTGGATSYSFASMHAKYIVVDHARVLVGSENLGPTGYPVRGQGNRGWGVVVESAEVAARFEEIFMTDTGGASGGVRVLEPSRPRADCPRAPDGEGRVRGLPALVPDAGSVETFFSPAPMVLERLSSLIRDSSLSIDAEHLQVPPRWRDDENAVLEGLTSAASAGTRVRLLMDSKYADSDPDSNLATLHDIDERGVARMEARLAVLGGLSKIHNKGFIFDSDAVWVGSANLGEASFKRNREAVIVLHSDTAAGYFADHFEADWGDRGTKPWPSFSVMSLVVAVAAGSLYAAYSSLSEAIHYRRRHK